MAQKETTVQLLGLAKNPNRLALPQGSCSIADNVVLRKPGVISACPAQEEYDFTTNDGPADTGIPVRLFSNFNRNYAVAVEMTPADGSVSTLRFSDDAVLKTEVQVDPTTTRDLNFDPGETQHNFVRNRHVFTEHSAPVVVDVDGAGHATTVRPAGLPPPAYFTATVDLLLARPILQTAMYTAYRAVYRRVTDNFELVSAPTPVEYFHNVSGGAAGVELTIGFLNSPLIAGDYVDIYRVLQKATVDELGDDFALCVSYQISAADIAAGSVSFTDPTDDASLDAGEALYTNSSQQGAGQANLMPPASVDVETFNDVTFYATKNAWPIVSLFVPYKTGDLHSESSDDKKHGIGKRLITGDTTIGSPNITNVANVDGVAEFQLLGPNTGFPAGGTIVNITGSGPYTVRIDTNAAATTSALVYTTTDTLKVRVFKDGVSTDTVLPIASFHSLNEIAGTVPGCRALLNGVFDTSATNIDGLSFSLWFPYPGFADSFEVYASNGANYSPNTPFGTISGLSKFVSVQDTKRNRVYFSKAQLPEAVAPTNFLDVGKETVIKLKRTQSSLLAYCTDGLWRITGSGTDWSVDQLDPDCRLVHPDCVDSADNVTFAWVLDGLATCGDDGATTFSTDAIGPDIRAFAVKYIGLGAPYIWGPSLACDLRNREMWLNLCHVDRFAAGHWDNSYIFNLDTQQFTTQSTSVISCQSYAPFLLNLLSGSITANSYSLPSDSAWLPANVQFNPITAGERGLLKQWIDVNSFFDARFFEAKLVLTFNTVDTANLIRLGAQLENMHFFVPRHCSSRPELQFGFQFIEEEGFPAPDFDLNGWTARYRVASETIRR